ncbi:hypothetical protein I4U23_013505 [Adineta vaga]|nr:hypothetical protein I4U23_013505 [Adineta vaga]
MPVTNLIWVQNMMIQYGTSIYFALGIIGSLCNIIMFTRPGYRQTPIWGLFPLFYSLNYTDLQVQSVFYCKTRLYIAHVLGQCIRYTVVLACIDRLIISQTNVHIRSFSSIRMAMKLIFGMTIVYFLIVMHVPFFMDIREGVCELLGIYKFIYSIYQIITISIIPLALMIVTNILTLQGLQQLHGSQARAKQRDRHFMRMLIAEVTVNIVTSIPYSANLIYGAVTYYVVGKSGERIEIEVFISFFVQFLVYIIGVAPFYLSMCASKTFRRAFLTLVSKSWYQYIFRRVRIIPVNEDPIGHS